MSLRLTQADENHSEVVSTVPTRDASPTSVNLFGVFFFKPPTNRHPERSASQIYRVVQRLLARSRRTPKVLISSMLFGAFRLPKPEN
jgi:hypothetical protein